MQKAYFGSNIISSSLLTTLIPLIGSTLVMVGVVGEADRQSFEELIKAGIAGIVAIVSLVSYLLARTEQKKNATPQVNTIQG